MELNRETVIKGLGWCSELRLCVDCPMRAEGYFSHSGNACRQELMRNALSLIKELTEENDRLSTALAEYEHKTNIRVSEEYVPYDDYEQLREEYKKLTEECERLQQTIARVKKYCQTLKIRIPPMSVVSYIEQIEKEFLEVKE